MLTRSKGSLRAAVQPVPRATWAWGPSVVMAVGAAMLVWSGVIHLHVWMDGYRAIPTIGWLFLLQAITAFVLAAAVLASRRLLVAAAGALFLASTAIGLVWSVEWGLFGFQDSFQAPFAAESLGVEAAGTVVLLLACLLDRRTRRRPGTG